MIGVATTCLAETIGDDVPMFIHQYRKTNADKDLPLIVHVSTPSYQGTHMQGFHNAVLATVSGLSRISTGKDRPPVQGINLFPGMVSPADLRHLKGIVAAFGLKAMVLPDYSQTLDGELWSEYHRIPSGGTQVEDIVECGRAAASIELGRVLAEMPETAATYLENNCEVPAYRLGLPMGIRQTDRLMETLTAISRAPIPERYVEERGRLLDALVDGHKYVNNVRAVVYGEADLVAGQIMAPNHRDNVRVIEGVDFVDIEEEVRKARPQLMIGHSKGYSLARKLDIPLVRIGFPVHDRVGGSRLLHLGYQGAQALFDRIANTLLEERQTGSDVGYTYM
jgi:nitrogenase molybdenum-iron protein NifN